jgi:DNA (cytosine-5)-methyltransferase 1
MTKFKEWNVEDIDLLVGGTPCQAFSVAGLRGGLSDSRGNLTLTFVEMADHFDPDWIVWENVPGVLSSQDNAFGCFLAGLVGASEPLTPDGRWDNSGLVSGPKRTVAWRILDAQYFGVAQRRRRVFVCAVRGSGNWAAARALFSVGESVYRDSAPRRETRQNIAKCITRGIGQRYDSETETMIAAHAFKVRQGCEGGGKGYLGSDELAFTISTHQDQHIAQPVSYDFFNITAPVNRQNRKSGDPCHTLARSNAEHAVVLQPVAFRETADCLTAAYGTKWNGNASADNGSLFAAQPVAVDIDNCNLTGDCSGNILAGAQMRTNKGMGVMTDMQVRRLTPTECERLQGFPDGYTNILWRNKSECPDGPRYKALGNSMAVPVMQWIGKRINNLI